jgi:dTDP-glucose pyrophosphorylase
MFMKKIPKIESINDPVRWKRALLSYKSTIEKVIQNLNATGLQIVLIVQNDGKFIGTISDGDIRRGLLKGLSLSSPISELVNLTPLTVDISVTREEVMDLMAFKKVHQIPVVDIERRLHGLYLWDEVSHPPIRKNWMVIMAGGFGTRLYPHTENCPKPMVLVGNKPMLEHIVDRARAEGFHQFIIAVHYLGHQIEDYFGDGKKFGIAIKYIRETSPMGTAGALSLIGKIPDTPIVVINGDVITSIKYGDFLDFHVRTKATATMAIRLHEWQNPYGVVNVNGTDIVGFEEKPISRSYINAGIYALSSEALALLPENSPCDMPSLFMSLKKESKSITAYLIHEPWIDIGRPSDLVIANDLYKQVKDEFK